VSRLRLTSHPMFRHGLLHRLKRPIAIFSLIALTLLLIKTIRQDDGFTLSSPCWAGASVLGVVVNSALLLAFVYGNLL